MIKQRRCEGIKANGDRCKNMAINGERFCHAHHPDRRQELIDNGRKGGKCPRRPVLPEREELTVEKARQLLSAASEMLIKGKMTAGVARSLAYLLQTDRVLKEHSEIIRRLELLESHSIQGS